MTIVKIVWLLSVSNFESKKVYLGIIMSVSGENGFLWPLGGKTVSIVP